MLWLRNIPVLYNVWLNQTFIVCGHALTVLKSFSNLYAPPPVAQSVVCRLEKFLSRPIWMKRGMACVGKRMKCRFPVLPHMVRFLSSRWTSRTPVLPEWGRNDFYCIGQTLDSGPIYSHQFKKYKHTILKAVVKVNRSTKHFLLLCLVVMLYSFITLEVNYLKHLPNLMQYICDTHCKK